jgi:hypothetical protein
MLFGIGELRPDRAGRPIADPPADTRPRRKRNDQLAWRPRVPGERVTDPDGVREGVARALDLLLQVDASCTIAAPRTHGLQRWKNRNDPWRGD